MLRNESTHKERQPIVITPISTSIFKSQDAARKPSDLFALILTAFTVLITLAATFALTGCSGQEDAAPPVSMDEVTADDMEDAYYLLLSDMPENSSMTSLNIMGSPDDDTVRASFTTIGKEGEQPEIAAEAESLLKLYSQKCAEAVLARMQKTGDEESIENWQQMVEYEQTSEDSQGTLFDSYAVIASIKGEDGLLIDGEREAGAESTWNWQ